VTDGIWLQVLREIDKFDKIGLDGVCAMLGDGTTMWDRLLAMTPNDDETWERGGRPKNIAWALDDMLGAIGRTP
jgi:hypothetical protein